MDSNFQGRYVSPIGCTGYASRLFHYFDMEVPTAFEVGTYFTSLVHTDTMIKADKGNMHRTYKAGNWVVICVSLLCAAWKKILLKSGMSTSNKDLQTCTLFNKYFLILMYAIWSHCHDGYVSTAQL